MSNYYVQDWKENMSINYYQNFKWTDVFIRQEKAFRNLIKDMKGIRSVLELGIGFGRMTKIVIEELDPIKYVGLDISPHQIENARKYVGDRDVAFIEADVMEYECVDKYDLVLASEILLHIRPEHIQKLVDKMCRFSKDRIIHIDWARDYQEIDWCFIHDYYTLFSPKCNLVKEIQIDQQSIWHWRVKE